MTNIKRADHVKSAADSVAERYWSDYYKDSGYGKQWVRKIPMRVKAELAKQARAASRTASKPTRAPELRPIATVITDKAVHLEGLAVFGSGDSKRVQAFVVDFDHEGNVHSFDAVDVA